MSLKNINPKKTSSWKALESHFNEIKNVKIKELFKNNNRANSLTISWDKFTVDYSKNRLNKKTLKLLFNLANECDLENSIQKQFRGVKINKTENRAVLHTAVRSLKNSEIELAGINIIPSLEKTREKIKDFTNNVLSGKLKGSTNKK